MEEEKRENNWLAAYKNNITSQNGEDGVIEKIFEVVGETNKWCVEFGAGSGKKGNNTWNLIENKGWSAVLIEAERALFQDLKKYYQNNCQVVCARAAVASTGKQTLDNILTATAIPADFDFLSIDIDGYDYHVWKAVERYRPRVVMIEINPNIPIDLEFVQPGNIRACGGSSLSAMAKLARAKGYELIVAFGVNAVFVKKELFPRFGINDNSPAVFFGAVGSTTNPPRNVFFQFYDGSIVLLGVKRDKVLAYRKKIKDAPVWVYEAGKLYPIKFTRDWKILRMLKNIVKATGLYYFCYPLVKKIGGELDQRRRNNIREI
ncbi:MAG: FkbM family methyltransferase [Patescibacteria group bacterium]